MHATFERDFAISGQRQIGASGLQDATKIGGGECTRRASAEIKRTDIAFLLNRAVCPKLHFLDQKIRVAIGQFIGVGVLVEHAVEAACRTKRHMNVGKRLSFSLAIG